MSIENKDSFVSNESHYVYISNQVLDNYEKLSAQYEYAQHELEGNPEDEILSLKALIKKQEIDLMMEEFDFTGSFNSEILHKDIGDYIRNTSINIREDGMVEALDDKYTWLGISLNGLASVNSLGGHSAGNAALVEVVSVVEDVMGEFGLDLEDFKIYHSKASDFNLRMDNSAVPTEVVAEIMTRLATTNLNCSSAIKEISGGVGPRLAVTKVKISEITELYNEVQGTLAEQKLSLIDFPDNAKAGKFFAGLLTDTIDVYREHEFLYSLADDVLTRMIELSENAEASASQIHDLKNYYQTYVQRFFMNTDLADFDEVFERITSSETAIDMMHSITELRNKASDNAVTVSIERVFGTRDDRNVAARTLLNLAYNKANLELYVSRTLKNELAEEVTLSTELENMGAKDLLFRSNAEEISSEDAKKLYITTNKKNLQIAEKSLSEVSILEPFEDLEDAEVIFLQNSFKSLLEALEESSFIDFSKPMQLDSLTVDMRKLLSKDVVHWSPEKMSLVHNLCSKVVETQNQKVDSLTGLEKKEIFYKKMDELVYDGVLDGSNLIARMADEGFLRGTNDLGGRGAGDLMLKVGAVGVENATNAIQQTYANAKTAISRYGGDEFATFIALDKSVGIEEVDVLYRDTLFKTVHKHKIPADNESKLNNYIPHEVQMSDGSCDISWGIKGIEALLAMEGLFSPGDTEVLSKTLMHYKREGKLQVQKSDIPEDTITDEDIQFFSRFLGRTMFNIADKYMDIKKSYERPIYIFQMYKNLRQAEKDLEETQVVEERSELARARRVFRLTLSYSQKALGNKGEAEFAELYSKVKLAESSSSDVDEIKMIEEHFNLGNTNYTESTVQEEVIKQLVELELYTAMKVKKAAKKD